MLQTFVNIPPKINSSISNLLSRPENAQWRNRVEKLHLKYTQKSDSAQNFIEDYTDALAYLGLRVPATYAQISSALLQIKETLPNWQPKTLLDLGSGPATAVWAANSVWPALNRATCIDQNQSFLSLGKEISLENLDLNISWQKRDLLLGLEKNLGQYDLVIISNLLNELSLPEANRLLDDAYSHCSGIMVIIEPGTPEGFAIIQQAARNFSTKTKLIAPYINNTFVESKNNWLHFPQRFIRPDYQRHIRQQMRQSPLMASDWEEAKYSFVAMGKIGLTKKYWGRTVGPVQKQHGKLSLPILTEKGVIQVEVWKRYKQEYKFAKNLRWGELIELPLVGTPKEE